MLGNENRETYFDIALATSLVLFGFDGEELLVLIKKKQTPPFEGAWFLPSAYVLPNEGLEQRVKMIMREYIGDQPTYLEQLKAFAKVFRNPEGRVINVSFYALIKLDKEKVKLINEENELQWVRYNDLPDLAYDHEEIITYAKERLKRRVKRRPVGFHLLPKEFTIAQLQTLYETTLDRELDKRNFRKKIFNSDLIIDTDKTTNPTNSRKISKLYRFDEDKYEKMSAKGYDFLF
ncbi:8-oxo-dGTP diphosphatase [Flavobacteriaceae bacterium UJ101]|nr:8-oxo-dGTP diphosphatase [Flavobacteriaceae bacterium UJ101]